MAKTRYKILYSPPGLTENQSKYSSLYISSLPRIIGPTLTFYYFLHSCLFITERSSESSCVKIPASCGWLVVSLLLRMLVAGDDKVALVLVADESACQVTMYVKSCGI
jgi:hypothetical protein